MLKQMMPPPCGHQQRESFMRHGDLGMSFFLAALVAYRFYSAFTLNLAGLQVTSWFGGAVLSLLGVVWFVWIRIRRRHLGDDSGEFMVAIFGPHAFTSIVDHVAEGWFHRSWLLDLGLLMIPLYFGHRVWRAPRGAREHEARLAASETKNFGDQGGL